MGRKSRRSPRSASEGVLSARDTATQRRCWGRPFHSARAVGCTPTPAYRVVLHLRAERDPQAVAEKGDLVLDEGRHARRVVVGGDQRKADFADQSLVEQQKAGAGDEIVTRAESRVVLRVEVERAAAVVADRLVARPDVGERLDLAARPRRRACASNDREDDRSWHRRRSCDDRFARGRQRVEVGPERAHPACREAAVHHERARPRGPVGAKARRDALGRIVGARPGAMSDSARLVHCAYSR